MHSKRAHELRDLGLLKEAEIPDSVISAHAEEIPADVDAKLLEEVLERTGMDKDTERLSDMEIDSLVYHGCSSGTSVPSMLRDAIVKAGVELRERREAEKKEKKKEKYPEQCYCGHLLARHMYREPPSGGSMPDDPEVELEFTHCAGRAPHNGRKEFCLCKKYQPFPFGYYRHLKTGQVYEVMRLGFNSADRSVEVEYTSVSYGETWHRPLLSGKRDVGFFTPDAETGRPRFEFIPNPTPEDLKGAYE